jgi:hypothetical protein
MIKRVMLVLVLVVTLIAGVAGGYTYAQTTQPSFTGGHVFSGDEIGFRIDGMMFGKPPRATLLIKIDGVWHEFQPNVNVTPLAK